MEVEKMQSRLKNCCRYQYHFIFWLLLFAGGFTMVFPGGVPAAEVVDRIVAIVNDDIIRLSELNERFEPAAEKIRSEDLSTEEEEEKLYDARSRILDDMIDQALADQQIQEAGIQVGAQEVDAAIEQVKQMNRYTDEDIRQALQMRGLTMESYRKEIKNQIQRNRLVNRKVKSSIVITDSDVRQYYENHREKYGGKTRYRLRNIFMPYPQYGDRQDREKVREEMEAVLDKLENGADFNEMARTHSDGPNAEDGGELGNFAVKDLSDKVRPVIENLEAGQFSDVIETERGFQIFYLEDVITSQGQSFEDVSAEIEKELYDQAVNRKFENWVQSLREEAHIKIIR
ncbi:MAG: peptidylprolyl isomerase [Thermodesulfobacteriota bacterium]